MCDVWVCFLDNQKGCDSSGIVYSQKTVNQLWLRHTAPIKWIISVCGY